MRGWFLRGSTPARSGVGPIDTADFNAAEYVGLFFELFQNSSDAVFLSRAADGAVLDANAAFFSLFGLDRDQVIGRTSLELGIWVSAEEREQALGVSTGSTDHVKTTIVRVRNVWSEEFKVKLSSVRLPFRGQEIVMGVAAVIHRPLVVSGA